MRVARIEFFVHWEPRALKINNCYCKLNSVNASRIFKTEKRNNKLYIIIIIIFIAIILT